MQLKRYMGPSIFVLSLALSGAPALSDELPSRAEMWELIQAQQAQIDALSTQQAVTDEKVEATGEIIEVIATAADVNATPGWWERTTVGGYGELHYNGGDTDEVDFHRFVLFFSHEFSDKVRFFSELEVEHTVVGEGRRSNAVVALEQAVLEFDIAEKHSLTAGIHLVPAGILNEIHEPPTFYGVERNQVETNIIPTTWREAGVGAKGELGEGFSYDVLFHSGFQMPTTGNNAFRVRNGRTNVAQAPAKDGAVTGRIQWTGVPGVKLSMTAQQQFDVTQGTGQKTPATLFEAHIDASFAAGPGRIGFKALGATWNLDSAVAAAFGRDEQSGWYIEPSYRFATDWGDLGFFARHSEWDNEAGDNTDSVFTQTQLGANFWPTPDTVIKLDYQFDDAPTGRTADSRLNLGVGYQF